MKNVISEPLKAAHVTKGDVFDDLGLSRAEVIEAKVKSDLWRDLIAHITPLRLTQKELAARLGVHQPEVSHLLNGKLSKFSAGTLIQYAVKLEIGVRVHLTKPRPTQAVVRSMSAKATGKENTRPRNVAARA